MLGTRETLLGTILHGPAAAARCSRKLAANLVSNLVLRGAHGPATDLNAWGVEWLVEARVVVCV